MVGCGARRMGCDARLRTLGPMKDVHKLLFLGALAGGLVWAIRKSRALRHGHVDAISAARGRSSIDDTPTLQPARPPESSLDVQKLDESIAPAAPF
jgi:hypothetical protein